MIALLAGLALASSANVLAQAAPTITPRRGLVITRSVRLRPGTYHLRAPASLDSAVIIVRGDDVTVDMRGVRLVGTPEAGDPDEAEGVALRIDGGRDVRVRGATIRGYRFGIMARGTRGLVLADDDVSHGWKPRLFSLPAHESLVDWLSFHHNEHDEWLRYGAGIYLSDVRGGELRGNSAEQGMNGILMTRADSLLVWNNRLSFNSGLGIGMYRSSHNRILHNWANFDVRGYSHGVYHRGQDSAALLMFEQCTGNVVAHNSMTHGGDGFFLWAGQQTMDTGAGGSDDNLVAANDFSFAPANGIEATFSRNAFVANRVEGSDYGMWGGYSHDSRILANSFSRNRIGVAIEHGQSNVIAWNGFGGDSTAIRLWADSITATDWDYPKHRDTRSRDYRIVRNQLTENRVGVRAANTTGLVVTDNEMLGVDSPLVVADGARLVAERNVVSLPDSTYVPAPPATLPDSIARLIPAALPGGLDPAGPRLAHRDRSAIIVDDWGPYDWRSPKLWPTDSGRGATIRLQVLGPPGAWRLVSSHGLARLARTRGLVPDTIAVAPDESGDWDIQLEYRGAATDSPRGQRRAAGVPYRFGYSRFQPRVDWRARWFAWSDSTDPRTHADAFAALLRGASLLEQHVARLDWEGSGAPGPGLPRERVALEATGSVSLPAGRYTLRAISDDAVRVWVDGRLAIDAWAPHESRIDYAPLAAGRHELRVQYVQVDGWAELRLDVLRGVVRRSAGSPGPH